jgi:hypothetical protein
MPLSGYFSPLKVEALHSSETSVNIHQTTWGHITEDSNLCNQTCSCHKIFFFLMFGIQ